MTRTTQVTAIRVAHLSRGGAGPGGGGGLLRVARRALEDRLDRLPVPLDLGPVGPARQEGGRDAEARVGEDRVHQVPAGRARVTGPPGRRVVGRAKCSAGAHRAGSWESSSGHIYTLNPKPKSLKKITTINKDINIKLQIERNDNKLKKMKDIK